MPGHHNRAFLFLLIAENIEIKQFVGKSHPVIVADNA